MTRGKVCVTIETPLWYLILHSEIWKKPISNRGVERTHQHKVCLIFNCIFMNAMIFLSLDIGIVDHRQVSTAASLWFEVRQATTSVCKLVLRYSSQFKVKLMTTCGTWYNVYSLVCRTIDGVKSSGSPFATFSCWYLTLLADMIRQINPSRQNDCLQSRYIIDTVCSSPWSVITSIYL